MATYDTTTVFETTNSDNLLGAVHSRAGLATKCFPVFFFLWKIIVLSGVQINDSFAGNYFFLFLPATPLSTSPTLEELFEMTQLHTRALPLPHALPPELQRNKDTIGVEAPGHGEEKLTAYLFCASFENTLSFTDP